MNLKSIVESLIECFLEAGDLALQLREKGLEKKIKPDNTPVSNGDLEVNKFISKKISELTVNAKQSGIQILNKSKDFYAACKEPAVRDIKSANYEIGKSVLIFDEVQDTRNLGSCLRTASFFGINSIIIPKNNRNNNRINTKK